MYCTYLPLMWGMYFMYIYIRISFRGLHCVRSINLTWMTVPASHAWQALLAHLYSCAKPNTLLKIYCPVSFIFIYAFHYSLREDMPRIYKESGFFLNLTSNLLLCYSWWDTSLACRVYSPRCNKPTRYIFLYCNFLPLLNDKVTARHKQGKL